MAIQLTDNEKQQVKAEYERILPTTGGMDFTDRFQQAASVLPADRRPAPSYPSGVPWLGITRKQGQPRAAKPSRTARPKSVAAIPPPATPAIVASQAGDKVMAAIEFFGDALAEFVAAKVAVKLEMSGTRFQQKTEAVETQLRKLKDVRRDLIAAKSRGDASRADALQRELESLQAWAATGPRAAAEVGAEQS